MSWQKKVGAAPLPLEPIRNPFLQDDCRKFGAVLDALPQLHGRGYTRAVEQLNDLSRSVLLRAIPLDELPLEQMQNVLDLFQRALELSGCLKKMADE